MIFFERICFFVERGRGGGGGGVGGGGGGGGGGRAAYKLLVETSVERTSWET